MDTPSKSADEADAPVNGGPAARGSRLSRVRPIEGGPPGASPLVSVHGILRWLFAGN